MGATTDVAIFGSVSLKLIDAYWITQPAVKKAARLGQTRPRRWPHPACFRRSPCQWGRQGRTGKPLALKRAQRVLPPALAPPPAWLGSCSSFCRCCPSGSAVPSQMACRGCPPWTPSPLVRVHRGGEQVLWEPWLAMWVVLPGHNPRGPVMGRLPSNICRVHPDRAQSATAAAAPGQRRLLWRGPHALARRSRRRCTATAATMPLRQPEPSVRVSTHSRMPPRCCASTSTCAAATVRGTPTGSAAPRCCAGTMRPVSAMWQTMS